MNPMNVALVLVWLVALTSLFVATQRTADCAEAKGKMSAMLLIGCPK
jgi:hypothetical protein